MVDGTSREEPDAAGDEFDQLLETCQVDGFIQRNRESDRENQRRLSRILQPRMNAQLEAAASALDTLAADHRRIVESTNLDLTGDTRQFAAWVVAGRCIGLARAAITLTAAGFTEEAVPTMRTVHETTGLLEALADRETPELLGRWLADEEWVRPGEVRRAEEESDGRLREALESAHEVAHSEGDSERVEQIAEAIAESDSVPVGHIANQARSLYDRLSRAGHSRRSGMQDGLSVSTRRMAVGPHFDYRTRGHYVEYSAIQVDEVIMRVGSVLGMFFGPEYYESRLRPLLAATDEARRQNSLV